MKRYYEESVRRNVYWIQISTKRILITKERKISAFVEDDGLWGKIKIKWARRIQNITQRFDSLNFNCDLL